jgi:hypothetical protein
LHDSKEIERFDKLSAIRFAKNLPQEYYTRFDQLSKDQGGDRSEIRGQSTERSDQNRDNQKRDKIRIEARGAE